MHVRVASESDAAAIALVHIRSWQHAYRGVFPDAFLDALDPATRADGWRQVLATTPQTFVAETSEGVVAFTHVCPSRDEDAADDLGELTSIYALPTAWGTGAGRALMVAALDHLTGLGLRAATLWVLAGNERAIRFYESAGWTAEGVTKTDELAGTRITEARYRRPLP